MVAYHMSFWYYAMDIAPFTSRTHLILVKTLETTMLSHRHLHIAQNKIVSLRCHSTPSHWLSPIWLFRNTFDHINKTSTSWIKFVKPHAQKYHQSILLVMKLSSGFLRFNEAVNVFRPHFSCATLQVFVC